MKTTYRVRFVNIDEAVDEGVTIMAALAESIWTFYWLETIFSALLDA